MITFITIIIINLFLRAFIDIIVAYNEEDWTGLIASFLWVVALSFFAKYIGVIISAAGF